MVNCLWFVQASWSIKEMKLTVCRLVLLATLVFLVITIFTNVWLSGRISIPEINEVCSRCSFVINARVRHHRSLAYCNVGHGASGTVRLLTCCTVGHYLQYCGAHQYPLGCKPLDKSLLGLPAC